MSRIWTGNNRAPWHDYASRCIYHFTLLKRPEVPAFGMLTGDYHLPIGSPGSPYVRASEIGNAIKQSLRRISDILNHEKSYPGLCQIDYNSIFRNSRRRIWCMPGYSFNPPPIGSIDTTYFG